LIIGSCLADFLGRYLEFIGSTFITVGCLLVSFFLSLLAFYESLVYIKLTTWISSGVLHIDWEFMFDSLIVCAAVTWAHYALLARARNHILTALISTVGLATLFTTSRILEYVNAHKRGIYGSCVFMTIRFHGFHVFVGTLVFFVIIILNHLMNTHYFGFKSAFWY
jgi:heme/copper-type cytochrome/quinol oxidase subunit 3